MITTEKAFDMLPCAVEIIEKLDMRGYILKNKELIDAKDRDTAMKEKGFDFMMHILKNTSKVKTEVFEILAIASDQSVEDIKAKPFSETLNQLKVLMQDEELMDFFKQAM